ncbi:MULTISPECIES: DMT family transporter [Vibrio]|uniref:DMT family transporter n=1 Tax=Vibrio casei TaxID=673372 RepID=A0A368LK40_9VIBR|nr:MULTISPECIES: DMT family transporter [Vibrio]RCS72252.1 DMT family transporter [Vibrio casei]SJN15491.1 Permease of the drug/metabolite transporter (DMT) superfamily [Vibrio casei]HBV76440.1 EamA/RhaT family transporter [Vibrio sp.]
MASPTNTERKAIIYGLTAVLLWSTVATAFKLTLQQLSPIQMLFIASLVSTCTLIIICACNRTLPQITSTFLSNPSYFLLLGLINPLGYYLILFKAYDLLPASQAQPLNYSWAITLTLMAALFLGHKIRKKDWVACGLGYLGVLIIATKGDLFSLQFDSPLGVGLALLSTLLWAGYWILNARNKANPIIVVLLGFVVSLPFSGALVWYEGFEWQEVTGRGWLAVIYVGLFEMGITFVAWLTALKNTKNTSRISNLIFLSPFISLMLLAKIIGETIYISTIIGLIFILLGLAIQQIKLGDK